MLIALIATTAADRLAEKRAEERPGVKGGATSLSEAEIAEISDTINVRGVSAAAVGLERQAGRFEPVTGQIPELRRIEENAMEAAGVNLDATWSGVSRGVYRLEDRVLVVMDIDRMQDGAGAEDVSAAA